MMQPTLASVPGILLRTTLRLFARLIFIGAAAFLLVGGALTLLCVLIGTWRTPRSRRTQLIADIFLLATEIIKERRRVTQTDSH